MRERVMVMYADGKLARGNLVSEVERIIRANIAFSLAIKVVFVVLAVVGLATLWMAVLADLGASRLAIGNGPRALRV